MFATVPGRLVVAPVVASPRLPDTVGTEPYSFQQLQERWGCSLEAVERACRGRWFKIGHRRFMRPAMVMLVEREMEEGR